MKAAPPQESRLKRDPAHCGGAWRRLLLGWLELCGVRQGEQIPVRVRKGPVHSGLAGDARSARTEQAQSTGSRVSRYRERRGAFTDRGSLYAGWHAYGIGGPGPARLPG